MLKNYLLIIISALSLGVVNILYKKSTSSMGPINTTFYYYLFGTIISFVLWILFKDSEKILIRDLIYPGLISVFLCLSILFFNIGLQHTKVSVSSTIRSFSFMFTIIISVIFLKEEISPKQIASIILAGVSIFLLIS